MTSDSMSARPTIIGTKILPEACGLRAIPSRAEPAARPWPMAPPRADEADGERGGEAEPLVAVGARGVHCLREAPGWR